MTHATRLALCLVAVLITGLAHARVSPGQPAPDFTLTGIDGKSYRLSDFRGRHVVLEWFNSECPFVRKHYESGNMQELQSRYAVRDVVWIGINSTSPRHSNFRDAARSRGILRAWQASPTAFLLDPDGKVGSAYGARTTPHLYIVDPAGMLIYMGGIDDTPSADPRDIPRSENFVAAALDQALSGRPVSNNNTRPYGCSIKYAD